jgi:hypothetical protein
MKKIGVMALLALLVAVLAYFAMFYVPFSETEQVNESVTRPLDIESETVPVSDVLRGSGSLDELRQQGKDMECTISYSANADATVVEGTYFVSDGRMRGDFLTETPDLTGQVLSSMIITGTTTYFWSEIEGEKYGMKAEVSALAGSDTAANEPVPLDQPVDYECKPWQTVDNTIFVPPGDVLFQDFSALMESGMEEATIYEEGAVVPEL